MANGVLYFGSDIFTALNAITGAKLWSYHDAPSDVGTAIVANGMVYVLGFTRSLAFGL